ncbi:hypothetical protein ACQKOF_02380 [Lysinibacillus sp. NPDC093190]|uniref:hypothetical protein n=1 Tax=Lysinibacillus sp. NPDC093190 TaxID=3390575 RepID=UPI003D07031F
MFKSKIATLLGTMALSGALLLPAVPAQAAWSDWQSVSKAGSGCKVRVYTDATNYSAKATTVDAKAESNGKCGTLYYDMRLTWMGSDSMSHDITSGSFSSNTPTKSLKIGDVYENEKTYIRLYLFTDSAWTNDAGLVVSDTIYLTKNK